MRFKLIIDETKDEEIVATVHERSPLTDQIEALILRQTDSDRIAAYADDDMKLLPFADISCITVLDGKTYAIDLHGKRYRLKQRLYELEAILPACFIRINKSALANENRLERFAANVKMPPMGHFGDPETEIGRACVALASPDLKYLSGETLTLEGGLGLRP